jgi:hypothetical protein
VRLTTLGYLGHMWELYAFWAWLPAFFIASRHTPPGRLETGAVVFAAFGLAGLAGPHAGTASMLRLRGLPASRRLAGGRG